MTRAQNIIELLEASGLEPHNFNNVRTGKALPKGAGSLKTSQGFEYGSGVKKKQADNEYQTAMKRKFMLTPLTGLQG